MRVDRWICAAASAGAVGWCLSGGGAMAQNVEARLQITAAEQGDVVFVVDDEQSAPPAPPSAGPTEDVIIRLEEPVGDGEMHIQAFDGAVGEGAAQSKFWIGVMCQPVEESLRAQLNLSEGQGVVVGEVLPDSPAAKSGLKKYDIILTAGDVKVIDAGTLMKVVEETGPKELKVQVIRAGQPNVINVIPAERVVGGAPPVPPPPGGRDRVYRLLERLNNQEGGAVMRLFHPGVVAPPPQALPENLDVRIEKQGNEPAKIHVEQDGKTWDVTENELDDLPEGLRGHIGRLVGHGGAPFRIHLPQQGGPPHEEFNIQVVPPPGVPEGAPLPPGAPPIRERIRTWTQRVEGEGGQPGDRLEKRLDQLNERLDRLQELIDRLQQAESKPEAAPPTP